MCVELHNPDEAAEESRLWCYNAGEKNPQRNAQTAVKKVDKSLAHISTAPITTDYKYINLI